MKEKLLLVLFLIPFLIAAEENDDSFFLSYGDTDGVTIVFNPEDDRIVSAELYREYDGTGVSIYEFSYSGGKFSESSRPGTCYYLKIYSYDGNIRESEKKCFSQKELFKKINYKVLFFLVLFVACLFVPKLFKGISKTIRFDDRFFLVSFIKTLFGEHNGRMSFRIFPGSDGNPLQSSVVKFVDELHLGSGSGSVVEIEFSHKYSALITDTGISSNIDFTSSVAGGGAFLYSDAERKSYLTFNISDGSAISDWYVYRSENDKRKVTLSPYVSGIAGDTILSKISLVSVEPFLLNARLKLLNSSETLGLKGVYLFLWILAAIVLAGSILVTVMQFFPGLESIVSFFGYGS